MMKKILAVGLIHIAPKLAEEAVTTVPKLLGEAYDYGCDLLFGKDKPVRDNTRLTVVVKEEIRKQHSHWMLHSKTIDGTVCNSQEELTQYFNKKLGLNKSRASYARIWKA